MRHLLDPTVNVLDTILGSFGNIGGYAIFGSVSYAAAERRRVRY